MQSNGINQTRAGDFGGVRERWIIANGVGVTTIDNGEKVQIREAVRGAEPTGAGITTTRHLAVGTRGIITVDSTIVVACPSASIGCNRGSGMVVATTRTTGTRRHPNEWSDTGERRIEMAGGNT